MWEGICEQDRISNLFEHLIDSILERRLKRLYGQAFYQKIGGTDGPQDRISNLFEHLMNASPENLQKMELLVLMGL